MCDCEKNLAYQPTLVSIVFFNILLLPNKTIYDKIFIANRALIIRIPGL